MFTPATNTAAYRIGKEFTLKRDIDAVIGTIKKGSVVKVISCGDRGYEVQDIDSGVTFNDCGFDIFEDN